MDGWDIADALFRGRRVPSAKLRRLSCYGDSADQLYVWLYQTIVERRAPPDIIVAIEEACGHQSTAQAWIYIIRYASAPTSRNFVKLAAAAAKADLAGETIINLSPIVLIGPHRRRFADLMARMASRGTVIDGFDELVRDLRYLTGPSRLRGRI